jgi:hypothetical protein
MIPSRKLAICLLSAALFVNLIRAAGGPHPSASDLEQLLGHPVSLRTVTWSTAEPSETNLWIYEVQPPKFDEKRMRNLADSFSIEGEIEPTPSRMDISGYWIKEPNSTNTHQWRSVVWSKIGMLAYYSGDTGYRWDLKNHKPTVEGVPTHEEAMQQALRLLPVFGITTNDLEANQDGSVRRQFSKSTTSYNERGTNERKEAVNKRTVVFFQRVPHGETMSLGEGGTLQVGFVSAGKVADCELLFRDLKRVASAKPMASKEIIRALERGRGWTYRQSLPETLTVTNCTIVYPQGNSSYQQKYVWPTYAVTGFGDAGDGTNTFRFFVPIRQ